MWAWENLQIDKQGNGIVVAVETESEIETGRSISIKINKDRMSAPLLTAHLANILQEKVTKLNEQQNNTDTKFAWLVDNIDISEVV